MFCHLETKSANYFCNSYDGDLVRIIVTCVKAIERNSVLTENGVWDCAEKAFNGLWDNNVNKVPNFLSSWVDKKFDRKDECLSTIK